MLCGLLIAVAFPIVEHRLSCSKARGIFPDQGLNWCLLRWQADSLPLSYQVSPCTFFFFGKPYYLWAEKAMAPHSSTLAWKIPWMEESGRLQSMGLLRVGHDWATSLSLFRVLSGSYDFLRFDVVDSCISKCSYMSLGREHWETNLGKEMEEREFSGFEVRQTWIPGLAVSLTSYITMGKSLNI